jgi:hypothetical protein
MVDHTGKLLDADKSIAIPFPYKYYVQSLEATPNDYPLRLGQEDVDEY